MKTRSLLSIAVFVFLILLLLLGLTVQSQINFEGLAVDHEGLVAWDADGTGPEPLATGHNVPLPGFTNQPYYGATRDYVDPDPEASGFHLLDGITGFPLFSQALQDNAYSAEQLKIKFGLCSLENDIQGEDWLIIGPYYYTNYYNLEYIFELDGELMISGFISYANYSINSTGDEWLGEYAFSSPTNASSGSSASVQEVANAFILDLGGSEMHATHNLVTSGYFNNVNGRNGRYMNVTQGIIEKGLPTIPFQGLEENQEGIAFWDSDGTGAEPLRNGHSSFLYYMSSIDYDDINPDPNAAFGHILQGIEGFINFSLQVEYRGYTMDQLKIISGLSDLDEDIEGEDWFGQDTLNYYHSLMIIELDGEPVIGFMVDTLNATAESEWHIKSSAAIVYNASNNSSANVQFIADAFMKDLESRQLHLDYSISFTGQTFNANGRSGYYYRVENGNLLAKESNCTRVYEGNVSGQWDVGCSPYIIEGDITIPEGATLTIEPGVWVKFMDRYPITVMGTVLAEGENTNSGDIVFTAVNPEKGWGGFDIGAIGNPELVVFNNCIFEYGSAYGEEGLNSGGAIAVGDFDNLTIDNCIFQNNKAEIEMGGYYPSGGAILLVNSNPVISNCIFINNSADLGGAIHCYDGSNANISRCLFHGNTAGLDGGAIEIWGSNPIFINNTFSLNSAENWGGAVDIYNVSQPDFTNCIFWGNTANQNKQISIYSNDCVVDINYCDVMAGEAGIGPFGVGAGGTYENNINEDPEFAETLAWDFRLSNASPCVNAGDPSIFDPDGTISDIGAFYYSIPQAPIALEAQQISNISFYATWEFDFEVSGYMLDVAVDEEFETLIPGYENLDVGSIHYWEVTAPVSSVYYYRIRAYNSAGVSEYSNVIMIDLALGKEESSFESFSGLYVVPNPIKNDGKITFILLTASEIQIEIFNYTGQKVMNMFTEKQQEGQINIPVDFNHLPQGSYVCKITSDQCIQTTKFIKY